MLRAKAATIAKSRVRQAGGGGRYVLQIPRGLKYSRPFVLVRVMGALLAASREKN
jgi:hypothetical protein